MIGWIAVAASALLVWVVLLVGHDWFWRTDQRLPAGIRPDRWPSVAVVVPARDEAGMLPDSLPTLLAQRYPGQARVILADDGSTDGTATLARRLAGDQAGGLALTVVMPGQPPPGWTGKLWALANGVSEAGEVDYLLFTDADIAHDADSLVALVSAAGSGRDLVSQMAKLRTENGWERLIVPAFVYFFAMLFPFRRVNRPGTRAAAAAGGCVLVRREALADAGGLAAISGALIDDVALARLVKRGGGRIWLGLAGTVRSVRPYPKLADLWQMVARSAYTQLRHCPLILAGTVVGMAAIFLAPPAATIAGAVIGGVPVVVVGGLAWLAMAGSVMPMMRYYGQPPLLAVALPVTALLYVLMTLDSARRHHFGGSVGWKGRTYST